MAQQTATGAERVREATSTLADGVKDAITKSQDFERSAGQLNAKVGKFKLKESASGARDTALNES